MDTRSCSTTCCGISRNQRRTHRPFICSIKVVGGFLKVFWEMTRSFVFAGHSRTIIGIEQKANGMMLLILDPSHGQRQVAALGSNQESLRLIRRGAAAMRAPQYQIVAVKGLIETKEQYQVRGKGQRW